MLNIYHALLVFAGAPQVLAFVDGGGNPITRIQRLIVEPASSNTHDCFVEAAGVATAATGSTDGVIRRLAKPPAADSGTLVDFFEVAVQVGNMIDTKSLQFDGTSGEKVRVTAFVA